MRKARKRRPGWKRIREGLRNAIGALRDMLYGATIWEMVRDLGKARAERERLFILIVFGDLLGVPIIPPYYTLRLLPHAFPMFSSWRVSLMHERDLTDLCDQEIT